MAVVVEKGPQGKPEFKVPPQLISEGFAFKVAQALNPPDKLAGTVFSMGGTDTRYALVQGATQRNSVGKNVGLRIGFTPQVDGGQQVSIEQFNAITVMPGMQTEGEPITLDNPELLIGDDVIYFSGQDQHKNPRITAIGRAGIIYDHNPKPQ